MSVGTSKTYKSIFGRFQEFCSTKHHSASSCSPDIIVGFLKSLYDKGSSYSLINAARSAISKYHIGFNGTPAGQHRLVCQAVKAVFRLNPPLPKYHATYDIQLVFTHIKSLQPLLTLKELTYKTLFLLTASSISRMSSVSVLGPKLLVYKVSWSLPILQISMVPFQDHCIVPIIGLEKTSRPGNIRGHLRIKAFTEDPSLCPVRCLVEYSDRVSFTNVTRATEL